jgi:hypothetical protein
MALSFRNAGAWGGGLGRRLHSIEADENNWDHSLRITALEDNMVVDKISNITQNGGSFIITALSGYQSGPIVIPHAAFLWRGDFIPAASYAYLDLIRVKGFGMYLVLAGHTAGASFNPDLLVSGNPTYLLIFAQAVPSPSKSITTAAYVPVAGDEEHYFRCTFSGACTITLPNTMAHDTELTFRLGAAGSITFAPASGDTVAPPAGYQAKTSLLGGIVMAKYDLDLARWELAGGLDPVV